MAIIKFYGNLKQYGDKYKINANTAAEALNCLYVQIKGLKEDIRSGFFKIRINKTDISEKTLQVGLHSQLALDSVIHIVPVIAGAKKGGLFSIIAGAALIVVGIYGNIAGNWGTPFITAGIGMLVGGVAQMLTKTPKMDDSFESAKKSTSFSNLENTNAQGAPVPLVYGMMMVGSKVVSQGVETMDTVD